MELLKADNHYYDSFAYDCRCVTLNANTKISYKNPFKIIICNVVTERCAKRTQLAVHN